MSFSSDYEERNRRAKEFLLHHRAKGVPHLNGNLFDHLVRTESLLRDWECYEDVCLVGLCHATYGTDGFAPHLLELNQRGSLRVAVGAEAEALVYLYASCDRKATYATLGAGCVTVIRDRFLGSEIEVSDLHLQAFVDITLANECDVGLGGSKTPSPPVWLLDLIQQMGHLAHESVREGVERLIGTIGSTP